MAQPAWRTALHMLTARDALAGELKNLNEAIHLHESDRGCALIAGALAENSLEQMIRVKLVPMGKTRMDDLFSNERPLSRFSSKIKIAFAFGVINKKLHDDLYQPD